MSYTGWICRTCDWRKPHGRSEAIDHAVENEGHEVGWLINGDVFEPLESPLVWTPTKKIPNDLLFKCQRNAFGNYYSCILEHRRNCPDDLQNLCKSKSYHPNPQQKKSKKPILTDFFQ